MPIIFQQQVNPHTKLGIWKIEEPESFFKAAVPVHRQVSHPHKRLQHLAGRYLLQWLYPDFPHELIEIADTRKPFLPNEKYQFSISHSRDYAAAIVSSTNRVGIDIEVPSGKAEVIKDKFLTPEEKILSTALATRKFPNSPIPQFPNSKIHTLLWSAKEAVFKWYGDGEVDFKEHIRLQSFSDDIDGWVIKGQFTKSKGKDLSIHFHFLPELVLAWVV